MCVYLEVGSAEMHVYSLKHNIGRTCMKKRRESKVGKAPRFRIRTMTTSARPRMSVSRIGRNVREWLQS